ncbi:MAG: U32 family peptidase [Methanobrevibacter millerae]|uniref:U32 family peptidase n=1 Tax=Methanobrevibacter millerae TaxID=230361 RepID=A0A8T3VEM5_9EURY|nr:U32 family peptidase [Methanobrevibacter millerae]MBE6504865.1 U32 family peptidase [Methanobrevibacter millerae]
MRIPELLAPVGSVEHLKIAINAGASSVYLSGKNYGARKFAENFTLNEIHEAVKLAHLHNVRVYVTVNTLIKESEIESVLNYLNELYAIGVDAVLIQDLGLIDLINTHIPKLKIHASTQLTCENQRKIDYLESKNVKRVVLPREMRKEEIENIQTNMELEIFAHGALCYSYSGQCLMSSFKGGRSGNRGTCAQPCRQLYKLDNKKDYFLSPRDLCLYDELKEIAELNIKCIKIEGRMRSKEYLAVVVSEYRKALNKLKSNKSSKTENLSLVFNRGFTKGQFKNTYQKSLRPGHLGLKIGKVIEAKKSQIAIKIDDNIHNIPQKGDGLLFIKGKNDYGMEISQNPLITSLNHFNKNKIKAIKDLTRKNKVLIIKKVRQNKRNDFDLTDSNVYLTKRNSLAKAVKEIENKGSSFIKSKLILTFSLKNKYPHLKGRLTLANHKELSFEVTGTVKFETPLKRNVSQETIKKQLSKLDNYPYQITQINMNYDGSLFIPIKEINKIRRELFEGLASEINKLYENKKEKIKLTKNNSKRNDEIAFSYYTNNLEDLSEISGVKRVYLEIPQTDSINSMVNFLKEAIETAYPKDYELIWKWPDIAHDDLINSLKKVRGILNKMHYPINVMSNDFNGDYGPYSMNIANTHSINSLENYKVITISPELRKKDYEDIIKNCEDNSKIELLVQGSVELMKTRYGFDKKIKNFELIDGKNNIYPIQKSLSGEELIIFNSEDLSLIEEIQYLASIGYVNFSIDGRFKNKEYINMIDIYKEALNGKIKNKEIFKNSTKGNY